METPKDEFVQHTHHEREVWTWKDLVGQHWKFCLCYKCSKLNTKNRDKNCDIANELYDFVIRTGTFTAVMECPEFYPKYVNSEPF